MDGTFTHRRARAGWLPAGLLSLGLLFTAGAAHAADPAAELHARLQSLSGTLARSPFGRPIHLDSGEDGDRVRGDVYALVDQPFARFAPAVQQPGQWCEVMILVINVKHCEATGATDGGGGRVSVNIARKPDQPLDETQRIDFAQRLQQAAPGYVQVRLDAGSGPLGTHDYRIVLEGIPAGDGRSFLHLHYGYTDSFQSKLAMQAYLGTAGRDKIGFTVTGRTPDGAPAYVQGLRGAIERTTMRYYLAIAAYLDSLAAPPAQRMERRLRNWFQAAERYPRQLHEMSESEYLVLKRPAVQGGGA
jgi:hypothetical protein